MSKLKTKKAEFFDIFYLSNLTTKIKLKNVLSGYPCLACAVMNSPLVPPSLLKIALISMISFIPPPAPPPPSALSSPPSSPRCRTLNRTS